MTVVQPQQGLQSVQPMMEQAPTIQEMQNIGDPHVDLLQRVTNQLESLSINLVQGGRVHQPQAMQHSRIVGQPNGPPQTREYFCYTCGEDGHGMYFSPHPRRYSRNGQDRGTKW